jgi:hypothetical protein
MRGIWAECKRGSALAALSPFHRDRLTEIEADTMSRSSSVSPLRTHHQARLLPLLFSLSPAHRHYDTIPGHMSIIVKTGGEAI